MVAESVAGMPPPRISDDDVRLGAGEALGSVCSLSSSSISSFSPPSVSSSSRPDKKSSAIVFSSSTSAASVAATGGSTSSPSLVSSSSSLDCKPAMKASPIDVLLSISIVKPPVIVAGSCELSPEGVVDSDGETDTDGLEGDAVVEGAIVDDDGALEISPSSTGADVG